MGLHRTSLVDVYLFTFVRAMATAITAAISTIGVSQRSENPSASAGIKIAVAIVIHR